MKLYL